jgi:NADPH:quinone reductase-like Zn-dependent oxidoreductase
MRTLRTFTSSLPVPELKAGEVLIKVHAAGVAVWDADERECPGAGARFPQVLGPDGSGIVVAVASAVQGFKVGPFAR